MFEAQVAYYLNNYLGKYVHGLDPQSLKISVFKGDVVLRNLKLKPEALQSLDLPITVKSGLLGSLTLKVRRLETHARLLPRHAINWSSAIERLPNLIMNVKMVASESTNRLQDSTRLVAVVPPTWKPGRS